MIRGRFWKKICLLIICATFVSATSVSANELASEEMFAFQNQTSVPLDSPRVLSASSLDGKVIAQAWQINEGLLSYSIYSRVSLDGGQTWGLINDLMLQKRMQLQGFKLEISADGKTMVLLVVGVEVGGNGNTSFNTKFVSRDYGDTWGSYLNPWTSQVAKIVSFGQEPILKISSKGESIITAFPIERGVSSPISSGLFISNLNEQPLHVTVVPGLSENISYYAMDTTENGDGIFLVYQKILNPGPNQNYGGSTYFVRGTQEVTGLTRSGAAVLITKPNVYSCPGVHLQASKDGSRILLEQCKGGNPTFLLSEDGGSTWSAERDIFANAKFGVEGHRVIPQGSQDFPPNFLVNFDSNEIILTLTIMDMKFIMRSSNMGLSWDTPHYLGKVRAENDDLQKTLVANRDYSEIGIVWVADSGKILTSFSFDHGLHWSREFQIGNINSVSYVPSIVSTKTTTSEGFLVSSVEYTGSIFKLYARQLAPFALIYDDNGSSAGAASAPEIFLNPLETIAQENIGKLQKTNSVFVGWNSKPDGSGEAFQPGGKIALSKSLRLYAQWKKIPFMITCVKGKLVKKVTSLNPVCPKGFTKKY